MVNNLASYSSILMNVKRDDGAVVYLNGVEAARFNMPAGDVNYLTTTPNASDDGANFWPATVPTSLLVEGTNVIAVEIHQTNPDQLGHQLQHGSVGHPVRHPQRLSRPWP